MLFFLNHIQKKWIWTKCHHICWTTFKFNLYHAHYPHPHPPPDKGFFVFLSFYFLAFWNFIHFSLPSLSKQHFPFFSVISIWIQWYNTLYMQILGHIWLEFGLVHKQWFHLFPCPDNGKPRFRLCSLFHCNSKNGHLGLHNCNLSKTIESKIYCRKKLYIK